MPAPYFSRPLLSLLGNLTPTPYSFRTSFPRALILFLPDLGFPDGQGNQIPAPYFSRARLVCIPVPYVDFRVPWIPDRGRLGRLPGRLRYSFYLISL